MILEDCVEKVELKSDKNIFSFLTFGLRFSAKNFRYAICFSLVCYTNSAFFVATKKLHII